MKCVDSTHSFTNIILNHIYSLTSLTNPTHSHLTLTLTHYSCTNQPHPFAHSLTQSLTHSFTCSQPRVGGKKGKGEKGIEPGEKERKARKRDKERKKGKERKEKREGDGVNDMAFFFLIILFFHAF